MKQAQTRNSGVRIFEWNSTWLLEEMDLIKANKFPQLCVIYGHLRMCKPQNLT
jgi:hypothetical protein